MAAYDVTHLRVVIGFVCVCVCPLICSTWGESFFILVQVLVILFLMFHYDGQLYWLAAIAPVFAAMCWYLTSGHASLELLCHTAHPL